jgi:predicted ATP-grasp superfamily ATP-dependent carboligase
LKKKQSGALIIEGHVQGLANTRALGEMGIPVIVIDKNNCIARYSKYCQKYYKCPEYNSEDFIPFLTTLADKENIRGWSLIPSNDHIVYNLSKNKQQISAFFKTMVPDFDLLMKIYDKYIFLKHAENAGIPVPVTHILQETDKRESLPYPVLVKGREGLSFFKNTGKKGIIADSYTELLKIKADITKKIALDKILIQEIIPYHNSTDVWSFTAFAVNGETKTFWIGRKLREHPARFGTATLAVSAYDENVENFGKKVIKNLNFNGVCEIEFIKDKRDDSFKLIEMNPRTWLWVGLAKYCGIDYACYIYEHLNNIKSIYPVDFKKDIKWQNFWTDLFFSGRALFKRELSFRDYSAGKQGEIIQAVYDKRDILPFVMMTLMLPYLMLKRT